MPAGTAILPRPRQRPRRNAPSAGTWRSGRAGNLGTHGPGAAAPRGRAGRPKAYRRINVRNTFQPQRSDRGPLARDRRSIFRRGLRHHRTPMSLYAAERWIEFNVQGAAAAIPSVAALSPAERDALAHGLDEDLQPIVDSYVESRVVVVPLETVLVVARRT